MGEGAGIRASIGIALGVAALLLVVTGFTLRDRTYCVGTCGEPTRTCDELNAFVDTAFYDWRSTVGEPRVVQIHATRSELRESACPQGPRGTWGISWDPWADDVVRRLDDGDRRVVWTLEFLGTDAGAPIGRFLVRGIQIRYGDDWSLALRHVLR